MTRTTRQIVTRYADASRQTLMTDLEETSLPPLRPDDVLAEMLAVPMHGSFWLASHPAGLHPRRHEFLRDGRFVFGNGGVARVVEAGDAAPARPGDVLAVFGHLPCARPDCRACTIDERYTECEFGEGRIIGHGAGAPDGTYADHVVLPRHAYERAFRAGEVPSREVVEALMCAFLMADVRNALTRSPDTLRRERVLLIGAGLSGRIAARLILQTSPQARIVAIDASADRANGLRALAPEAVDTLVVPTPLVEHLNRSAEIPTGSQFPDELDEVVARLAGSARARFDGRPANLIVDTSSGHTAPLWCDPAVVTPGAEIVLFGFGSPAVRLGPGVLQTSGLTIRTSRGVGTRANRQAVVSGIITEDAEFVHRFLLDGAVRLDGLDCAVDFIRRHQDPPRMAHEVPTACIVTIARPA